MPLACGYELNQVLLNFPEKFSDVHPYHSTDHDIIIIEHGQQNSGTKVLLSCCACALCLNGTVLLSYGACAIYSNWTDGRWTQSQMNLPTEQITWGSLYHASRHYELPWVDSTKDVGGKGSLHLQ